MYSVYIVDRLAFRRGERVTGYLEVRATLIPYSAWLGSLLFTTQKAMLSFEVCQFFYTAY